MRFTGHESYQKRTKTSFLSKLIWVFGGGVSLAITTVVVLVALQKDTAPPKEDVLVARMGEVVSVGDLDLTILGTAPFLPGRYSFSEANYAVRFRANNARGGAGKPYELAHTDLKVLDNSGTVRDAVPCVQCPGQTGDDITTRLAPGESIDGTFYYKLLPGVQASAVTYRQFSSSVMAKVQVPGASLQGAAPVGARSPAGSP
jgi:hypothetical protein